MSQFTKKAVTLFATFALVCGGVVVMSGCNTTEGVGKDIKATGKGIENAADKAND